MKPGRKLTVAILLVLISLAFASGASYAWFSLALSVNATGISLSSTAPDNLLISIDGEKWSNTVVVNNVTGGKKIYPASTVDGINFYTLTDDGNVINGDKGGVLHDDYIHLLRFKEANTPVSENSDGYFTTYELYIKTLGSDDVEIYVDNLIPKSSSNLDECIRIAIFKEEKNADNFIGTYDAGTPQKVSPVASISGTLATLAEDPKKVFGKEGPKMTVPGGGVDYLKLVVVLWIEGQNSLCLNEVAGDTFIVDLKFNAVNE